MLIQPLSDRLNTQATIEVTLEKTPPRSPLTSSASQKLKPSKSRSHETG
nr:hypothetical protein [Prochlorococcus marinus]